MAITLGASAVLAAVSGLGVARAGSPEAFSVTPAELAALNGDIFWAPASASDNVVTRHGDEARAVFGPIPDGDCLGPGSREVPVEVGGNRVDLRPNPDRPGAPLEFAHLDARGAVVRWTEDLGRCDKPSLAGEVTYCGTGSRINRVVRGNVDWLFLCRKSNLSRTPTAEPYWQGSNPEFALYGAIGFNRRTGEMVFFDGRKDQKVFDWRRRFVAPGGRSYSDTAGRVEAEALYDPTFAVQCSSCHDNKSAYIVTPRVSLARVGYRFVEDERTVAVGLGDYLPNLPRTEDTPLRVVGTGYTARYRLPLERARTVRDPAGGCTACHTLTTQLTGQRFTADAVARKPVISWATWAQLTTLYREQERFAIVAAHRTEWASREGEGRIHPWMTPGAGNLHGGDAELIREADWRRFSDCLWGAGGPECGYRPLFTACPAPGQGPDADGFAPKGLTAVALDDPMSEGRKRRIVSISWRYRNGYGGVMERDDVRFNVAIAPGSLREVGEAPTLAEAMGEAEANRPLLLIRDVSFEGHERFTDPPPTVAPRRYRVDVPAACGRRYHIRIAPVRACFDPTGRRFGHGDYVVAVDAPCPAPGAVIRRGDASPAGSVSAAR